MCRKLRNVLIVAISLFQMEYAALAVESIQSKFYGPVKAKVWQHWQQSWNVENLADEKSAIFNLVRGFDAQGKSIVEIRFRHAKSENLTATLMCDSYIRDGQWNVKPLTGKALLSETNVDGSVARFQFLSADECLDQKESRIVSKISFKISSGQKRIFGYSLLPMYVRGKDQPYWDNPIPPYSAHAGSGSIAVANSMAGESGWDQWGGIVVKPILGFVDRNRMDAGSSVGLHRHERNQEMYLIKEGSAEMRMGVTSKKSDLYVTSRIWDEDGNMQNVNEFYAEGGWIEARTLKSGEISVIVPDESQVDTVYFHGISAIENTVFWTMGSKN